MRKINNYIRDNRGSAVVEVSFVMPFVILIVFMTIALFIHNVQDGISQGTVYENLYLHSSFYSGQELQDNISAKLNDTLLGEKNISVIVNDEKGSIVVNVRGICGAGILEYNLPEISYETEIDLCTKRLRRWQLYGDVLPD